MRDPERDTMVAARDEGRIDEDVMRRIQRDLDLEETLLSRDESE